jgi:hypothetical protein
MNGPTQQKKPEYAGQDEHDDGLEEPALEELAQSRYEEAAERGDNIPSRSLPSHVVSCRDCRMNIYAGGPEGEEPSLATHGRDLSMPNVDQSPIIEAARGRSLSDAAVARRHRPGAMMADST